MPRALPAAATPAAFSWRDDLLAWFDRERRDLPWRRTKDPYAIWISEVMLQQTQVSTVIPYWQRFLARFPDVRALAAASFDDVSALWRGLGYYSRARNLHRAAIEIVERFGGELPRSVDALLSLPGFGRYTAGAVASIAFDVPAPIVDGNVARVFARMFEVEGAPGDREREKTLWALAGDVVQGGRAGDFNQALMELGATVCRPEAPLCLLCPVRASCGAQTKGRVAELPPPRVRAARKKLVLAVGVLRRRGAVLLGRREAKGLFGGLWELPSAPSADGSGESLTTVLGSCRVERNLGFVKRTLTHRDLELHVFELEGRAPKKLDGYAELRFVGKDDAEQLGISTAMQHALALAFE